MGADRYDHGIRDELGAGEVQSCNVMWVSLISSDSFSSQFAASVETGLVVENV